LVFSHQETNVLFLLTIKHIIIMEGTLAEIRMFAGNFAPRGWQFCNGQLLPIAQWTAVFALVGTTYGGDGQTTFGIPDFRGRVAVGTGNGAGLPSVQLGEMSGTPSTTLLSINLPAHNHQVTGNINVRAASDGALVSDPVGKYLGPGAFYATGDPVNMAPTAINLPTTIAGSSSPVSIMQPYMGMNHIFCVEGIFPSRN
jgi:microcystin-dependent protein